MNTENESIVSEESLSKITMLLSAQVTKHALEDLRHTSTYKAKLKTSIDQCLIAINNDCNKDIAKLWETDEIVSMKLMQSISDIALAIAKCKNPIALLSIRELLRQDLDLDKIKVVELKHKIKYK